MSDFRSYWFFSSRSKRVISETWTWTHFHTRGPLPSVAEYPWSEVGDSVFTRLTHYLFTYVPIHILNYLLVHLPIYLYVSTYLRTTRLPVHLSICMPSRLLDYLLTYLFKYQTTYLHIPRLSTILACHLFSSLLVLNHRPSTFLLVGDGPWSTPTKVGIPDTKPGVSHTVPEVGVGSRLAGGLVWTETVGPVNSGDFPTTCPVAESPRGKDLEVGNLTGTTGAEGDPVRWRPVSTRSELRPGRRRWGPETPRSPDPDLGGSGRR